MLFYSTIIRCPSSVCVMFLKVATFKITLHTELRSDLQFSVLLLESILYLAQSLTMTLLSTLKSDIKKQVKGKQEICSTPQH